jgi:hypothetical protein
VSSNLTPAGQLSQWSDGDIFRVIRNGVDKDGRWLIIMSNTNFGKLSDDDTQAGIAYIRSLSGFGVAYPEPLFAPGSNWEHREGVSGQRLPDMDLLLNDGSRTTLYRLLKGGCWVRLQVASDDETTWKLGAMTTVTLALVLVLV